MLVEYGEGFRAERTPLLVGEEVIDAPGLLPELAQVRFELLAVLLRGEPQLPSPETPLVHPVEAGASRKQLVPHARLDLLLGQRHAEKGQVPVEGAHVLRFVGLVRGGTAPEDRMVEPGRQRHFLRGGKVAAEMHGRIPQDLPARAVQRGADLLADGNRRTERPENGTEGGIERPDIGSLRFLVRDLRGGHPFQGEDPRFVLLGGEKKRIAPGESRILEEGRQVENRDHGFRRRRDLPERRESPRFPACLPGGRPAGFPCRTARRRSRGRRTESGWFSSPSPARRRFSACSSTGRWRWQRRGGTCVRG